MNKTTPKRKTLPVLMTDEEAERFVDEADLSEYDLSGFQRVQFTFANPDQLSLSLPEALSKAVAAKAEERGVPAQQFMLEAIEDAVRV